MILKQHCENLISFVHSTDILEPSISTVSINSRIPAVLTIVPLIVNGNWISVSGSGAGMTGGRLTRLCLTSMCMNLG